MALSTRTRYGLRALIELAGHYGRQPVKRSDISARQNIPEAYLVQLFVTLRTTGLIRTLRGPSGGCMLARDPSEISILSVIEAFEGESAPPAAMPSASDRAIDQLWHDAELRLQGLLAQTSLDDLRRRMISLESQTMFHI